MLRYSTVLAVLLAGPVAAQVPAAPPVPKSPPPAASAPVARSSEPMSPFYSKLDLLQNLDQARAYADMAKTYDDLSYSYAVNQKYALLDQFDSYTTISNAYSDASVWGGGPRSPWVQNDPADSLYRSARDLLNRGDYRRSASLFKELPQKFPSSAYVNDAMYWQAWALYRMGGTAELQEALNVLEALKAKTPPNTQKGNRNGPPNATTSSNSNSSSSATVISGNTVYQLPLAPKAYTFSSGGWGGEIDVAGLSARIANVLSSRGMGSDPAVKRALADAGDRCDSEDQQVRSEALSALMQSDPETARQSATRILARKDECSVPLRRTAVQLVANKKDDGATAILIPIAKNDPSIDVRTTAIDYLGRMPSDAALNALQDLTTSDNDRVQRAAVRALASSPNARARTGLRALIEKNDAPEPLRLTALDSYGRESNADDVAWLKSAYQRVTSPRVKEYIVSAVGRVGGDASDAWLSALVRNEDEPMEARMSALRQAGRSMDIAALVKLYDGSSQRQIRSTTIDLLSNRKEPAAVDKLIEIAKNGTDPSMRRSAISALARSKDPRAQKLLLDLVDHQ